MIYAHECHASAPQQPAATSSDPKLQEMAERLWPDDWAHSAHNRAAWFRAVWLARRGPRGWVVDLKAKEAK